VYVSTAAKSESWTEHVANRGQEDQMRQTFSKAVVVCAVLDRAIHSYGCCSIRGCTRGKKVTFRRKREWYGRKGEVSTGVTFPQMANLHDAAHRLCSVQFVTPDFATGKMSREITVCENPGKHKGKTWKIEKQKSHL
jgi:hypothetical protein